MNRIDMENRFWLIAKNEALPSVFSHDCETDIKLIIQKGIKMLADDTHPSERLDEAESNLKKLILIMKKNATSGELTAKDLANAKEKLCPTWPCKATEIELQRGK